MSHPRPRSGIMKRWGCNLIMRLDTLGKSPLVIEAENSVLSRAPVITIRKIPEAQAPSDSGPSTGQDGDQSRLGKIIDLLEKSKEREKKRKPAVASRQEALKAYQRLAAFETQDQSHVGQTLSIRV